MKVSGVRFQGKEMLDTDTWHPTPETNINYHRASCPQGATFSGRRLAKSIVPIYQNRIIFAMDLSTKMFSPPRHKV